ncbi:hypothetical protein [Macrococcus lamae]|uniref:DUF3139 domain-containing protein n=1 Tax=Macrococcus lamae TaxID=198484 RepID=A0A4R6BUB1_9STAP|nr:hypothetical protein [Macrococcus lamae]TDM11863.1 hypothetical protein ERX29_05620 [Macrococcus lamae]
MTNKTVKWIFSIVLVLTILFAGIYGFIQYKVSTVQDRVAEYMVKEKQVKKEDFKAKGFMANRSGDKNYMVEVKVKKDPNYYYYYRTSDDKVKLEFYLDKDNKQHFEK